MVAMTVVRCVVFSAISGIKGGDIFICLDLYLSARQDVIKIFQKKLWINLDEAWPRDCT